MKAAGRTGSGERPASRDHRIGTNLTGPATSTTTAVEVSGKLATSRLCYIDGGIPRRSICRGVVFAFSFAASRMAAFGCIAVPAITSPTTDHESALSWAASYGVYGELLHKTKMSPGSKND
ncbi:hypothetical protein VTN96DRAFT_890 [Rasamsonia emersonii]